MVAGKYLTNNTLNTLQHWIFPPVILPLEQYPRAGFHPWPKFNLLQIILQGFRNKMRKNIRIKILSVPMLIILMYF